MPHRARELNDQPTEARIRQVIRSILDQEVRRLLTADAGLAADIAVNVADIAANVIGISNNQRRAAARNNLGTQVTSQLGRGDPGEIDNLARRAAARNNLGASSTFDLGLCQPFTVETTTVLPSLVWTLPLAAHTLMGVGIWEVDLRDYGACFNHTDITFNQYTFNQDAGSDVKDTIKLVTDPNATYTFTGGLLSVRWPTLREGHIHVYNLGCGTGFFVTAVSI